MDGYYEYVLKQIAYAFTKILNAVESKNLDAIKSIALQEINGINEDLNNLKGDKN